MSADAEAATAGGTKANYYFECPELTPFDYCIKVHVKESDRTLSHLEVVSVDDVVGIQKEDVEAVEWSMDALQELEKGVVRAVSRAFKHGNPRDITLVEPLGKVRAIWLEARPGVPLHFRSARCSVPDFRIIGHSCFS